MNNTNFPLPSVSPSKKSHLATLALYDDSVLERLIKLAETTIVPEDDQLINVTFEQMVDKAHALADTYFPEWTDRSKADFGEFLVELFCLFSEKDFWYINAFANEGFLQKATLYRSIYAHALRLGYFPITLRAAKGWVNVVFDAGDAYTYSAGELRFTIGGESYSNCETFILEETLVPFTKQVRIAHGNYSTFQTTFNGKSVIIDSTGVDPTMVEQTVANVYWNWVESFAQSDENSTHFITVPDEESRIEVCYGKNGFGKLPNYGETISTKYLVGGGTIGNQANISQAVTIASNLGSDIRIASSATLVGDIYGGTDIENMEYIRNNAPVQFRTLGRIINSTDCEDILNLRTEIYQSKATIIFNVVSFYVILQTGVPATQAEMDVLAEEIIPQAMEGVDVYGVATHYIETTALECEAVILQGFDEAVIIAAIQDILANWHDPNQEQTYGLGLNYADVTAEIIRSVPGVQNVINWYATSDAPTGSSGLTIDPIDVLKKLAFIPTVTISY